MSARRRIALVGSVFVTVLAVVAAVLIGQLYRVGFQEQRRNVEEIARSRAAFLGAVARFDADQSTDFPGGSGAATLEQLRASHAESPGFGSTGEYLVGRRVGDSLVFDVPLRHTEDGTLGALPLDGPDAQPMIRALAGESGTMVGRDYRGESVLAAYRPLPDLDRGLVAKIDVAEIRAPFVRAGLLAGLVALVLGGAGVFLIHRVGWGLVSRLERSEGSLREREKALEEALGRERRAREQLGLALAAANQGVWDFDPRTGDVEVSPEFEAMLGYEPGGLDMTYDLWEASLHPADRERTIRTLEEYMNGRADVYESEFRMRGADGAYRWILSLGQIVERDDEGTVGRFVGTHTDITHLKAFEEELSAREAHLREAQAVGRMGSWQIVPARNEVWWSEGLYALLGMDPAEVEPDPERFLERVHPDDRSDVRRAVERMARESTAVEVEFRVDVAGETRRIHGMGRPSDTLDGEERFLGVVRDVSEERLMEEMLRQSQKMEAVGQLTAGLAHDFNNLLTTILANSDPGLLGETERKGSADRALRAQLDDIHAAARRGGNLIRQLMTLTRDRTLRVEPTELSELLRDMSGLLRRLLPENVALEVDPGDVPLDTSVDRGAVQQIILNVANNARDAMPSGGRFVLRADRVDAAEAPPGLPDGSWVRLRAMDTGTGMAPEVLGRAFDPFFTTKPPGAGTGLGLAMVYGLMHRQGGTAHLSSEPGRGTTVSLFFPWVEATGADGDAERNGDHEARRPLRGEGTVLLVEDDPALRRTGRRILQQAGYDVAEAEDGERAMEVLVEDTPIRLVVTDVIMPGAGGVELLRRCGERGLTVPFLFMSGYSAEDLAGDQLPPDQAFLPKPWTAEEFLDAVRTALAG